MADAVQETKVSVVNAAEDVKAAAITTWDRIKDATYEKRSEFSASLAKRGGQDGREDRGP